MPRSFNLRELCDSSGTISSSITSWILDCDITNLLGFLISSLTGFIFLTLFIEGILDVFTTLDSPFSTSRSLDYIRFDREASGDPFIKCAC